MNFREDVTDFIGVYENALSRDICDTSIDLTERLLSREGIDRKSQFQSNLQGQDKSWTIDTVMMERSNAGNLPAFYEIDEKVTECTNQYLDNFPAFQNMLKSYHIKFQKTEPTEGYHVWHSENSVPQYRGRDLVWAVFLNDVNEGGELEFLYQRRRITPKQGTIVVWPAAFTHTHRGNPPLSGTKYIATGWWTTCETE